MGITENAAYLKGLAEGMNIDKESNEGKLIVKMLDVISEMSERINTLEILNEDLYEYMEQMAEDIVAIEDDLYLEDEDDLDEYEDYSDLNDDDDDFSFDDEEEYYEVECPSCGEKICFTEELDTENMVCPACGNKIGAIEFCDGDCSSCDDCD